VPNLPASWLGPSPPAGRGMTRGPIRDPGQGPRARCASAAIPFGLGTMSTENHDDDFHRLYGLVTESSAGIKHYLDAMTGAGISRTRQLTGERASPCFPPGVIRRSTP